MGLNAKTVHFRRLHRIVKDMVHQQLEVAKTISQQDKVHLEATKVNIAKIAPFFNRFAGLWPIHAMIRTYLLNMQTRRRKDLQDEKEWTSARVRGEEEPVEVDTGSADEDGDEEMDVQGDEEGDAGEEEDEEGDEEDEEDEEKDEEIYIPVKVSFVLSVAAYSNPYLKPKPSGHALKVVTISSRASAGKTENTQKKRKAISPPVEVPEPKKVKPTPPTAKATAAPKRKAAPPATKPAPAAKHRSTPKPAPKKPKAKVLTWIDIPAECPAVLCEEELPAEQNDHLLSLFQRLENLKFEVGSKGAGVALLHLEICAAISEQQKAAEHIRLGVQNDWPAQIKYSTLVPRILELKEPLLDMFQSTETLEESLIFQKFLTDINHRLFAFSNSESKRNFKQAILGRRCGYYGPRGEFIINSTIYRMLSTEDEQLEIQLCTTLSDIIEKDCNQFDEYDPTSNLLSIKGFQDRDIDLEEAMKVLTDSNNFGVLMQPDNDDDSETDELHRKNILAMKRGKNHFFAEASRYIVLDKVKSFGGKDVVHEFFSARCKH
ncbi:hypothetical protein B0H16DRAFT_1686217 [Mycena metata]|uniref:Restriction of telomere capping protein 4 C-terminal domain-containing protein n=1 Tax=Mycena metata TaxID=1033252 RepID=A0AAD7JTW3_9AGAR|nr:hypothetical protein B0H16DRAFT_1686217 [Mycena metata]